LARFICGVLIYTVREFFLVDFAKWIDDLFSGHPHLLLYTVMVLCPLLMNLAQVWIQDSFLKLRQGESIAY